MKFLKHILLIVLLALAMQACVPRTTTVRRTPPAPGADTVAVRDTQKIQDDDLARVRWVRIYGAGDEQAPPILRKTEPGKKTAGIGSDALTLSFDMQSNTMPNPVLQLVHCDQNWAPTQSLFVQDPLRLRSDNFKIERAPATARYYDYSLQITFPGPDQNIRLEHSGNYLARVVDYYNRDKILAEARFFVVENKSETVLTINSDFFESVQTKAPQRGLRARVQARPATDLYGSNICAVHLFRDAVWNAPMIARQSEFEDAVPTGNYQTTWSSNFGSMTIAQFINLPAGNEHRILDLTDLAQYPASGVLLASPLSDLPRGGLGYPDHDGVALTKYINTRDEDYVFYQFRLDLRGYEVKQDLFVVGTFNNWTPTREWQLSYDRVTGYYVVKGWLKRAYHEYQYVAGTWDDDKGQLRDAESTLLEANISQSTHTFYAIVYYHDPTLGGFDRIVGVARTQGSYW